MAIKDNDGNVFRLKGPNPLMKEQDFWDKNSLVLLNMKFDSIVEKCTNQKTENKKTIKPTPQPKVEIKEVEIEPEIDNVVVIPKVEEKQESVPKYTYNVAKILSERKISFHCLPTILTKDEYGEEVRVFSKKFIFEGITVKEEDFSYSFWSDKKIEIGSIIFPISSSKRWWKVTYFTEISGGYMMTAILSHLNPDFTD